MSDRAGFFAGLADILTAMCVYYVAAGILIIGAGWGVHIFWLLLCAAGCACAFPALLKKPRSTPLLTAVTGGLALACLGVFLLVSDTPLGFGYVFVLCVGAGMAAGLPLYTCLNRPTVMRHLTHLEVLILALVGLMLAQSALGIGGDTVGLMVLVLLMDAAAAVGLRMSDGEIEEGGAFKASMAALAAAAATALLIGLLSLLFSRSGEVTGGLIHGLGAFFSAIGRGIEGALGRLAALVRREERFEALDLEEMPSLAGIESQTGGDMEFSVNTTALGVILSVIVLAAATAAAVLLRKKRVSMGTNTLSAASHTEVRRSGGTMDALWQRLKAVLAFRWTAFLRRDTPAGVLLYLERRGRRLHTPRGTGESMRAFLARMDPSGGLDELSGALDREYYGGGERVLSGKRCRELRRYIRKAVRHG